MTLPTSPRSWAGQLSRVLNVALPEPARFPVDVASLAREYTANVFPKDPIRRVEGAPLPGFEGALIRIPAGAGGWGIAYNSNIRSPGRIRFTLAHELGHYLVHRQDYPNGINCSERDVMSGIQSLRNIEREADQFAADLLMPFDDYRRQIAARDIPDLDIISACADRYGVSFVAAALRWIAYTERRAILAVSRDGFLLWTRSSESAYKTGAFFRTANDVVELPVGSLAALGISDDSRAGKVHPPGVWVNEEVREMTIYSEQYDIVVSLLLLGDAQPRWERSSDNEDDPVSGDFRY
jgi:hypothetical protein